MDGFAIVVDEFNSVVGHGGVGAGAEEGVADGVAEVSAFRIDGVKVLGNDSGEGIKDRARRNRKDARLEGSERGAEGNFLGDSIAGEARERREGDREGSISSANDDRDRGGLVGVGSHGGVDDGGRVERHGDGSRGRGSLRAGIQGTNSLGGMRSHVTKSRAD